MLRINLSEDELLQIGSLDYRKADLFNSNGENTGWKINGDTLVSPEIDYYYKLKEQSQLSVLKNSFAYEDYNTLGNIKSLTIESSWGIPLTVFDVSGIEMLRLRGDFRNGDIFENVIFASLKYLCLDNCENLVMTDFDRLSVIEVEEPVNNKMMNFLNQFETEYLIINEIKSYSNKCHINTLQHFQHQLQLLKQEYNVRVFDDVECLYLTSLKDENELIRCEKLIYRGEIELFHVLNHFDCVLLTEVYLLSQSIRPEVKERLLARFSRISDSSSVKVDKNKQKYFRYKDNSKLFEGGVEGVFDERGVIFTSLFGLVQPNSSNNYSFPISIDGSQYNLFFPSNNETLRLNDLELSQTMN